MEKTSRLEVIVGANMSKQGSMMRVWRSLNHVHLDDEPEGNSYRSFVVSLNGKSGAPC